MTGPVLQHFPLTTADQFEKTCEILEKMGNTNMVLSLLRVFRLGMGIRICVWTILAATVLGNPAAAKEDAWIWCKARSKGYGASQITLYYSATFFGDYSRKTRYENAFNDYLRARYDDIRGGDAGCFFEDSKSDARAERDDNAADSRSHYREIVFTDWQY